MLLDLLGPPGRCSGCWPYDGEVAGGAVAFSFSELLLADSDSGRPMMMMMMTSASPGRAGAAAQRRAQRSTGHRQRSPKFRSTDVVSHGFGETRVQNSSKTLVSKKAVALTTLASFI
jgi:hypothetical protein